MFLTEEDKIIRKNIGSLRMLLTEWVDRNEVIDSINKLHKVYMYYNGDKTNVAGYRTILPYAFGISTGKTKSLVLRAWQEAGTSDTKREGTGIIPGWRLFRLDGIKRYQSTYKHFDPNDKTGEKSKYNPNDKGMRTIIVSASEVQSDDSQDSIFDKQSNKFKDFYDVNKDMPEEIKLKIANLYEIIRDYQKEKTSNYIIIRKSDGGFFYDKIKNKNRYKPEEIVGNLEDVFKDIFDIEKNQRLAKNFINKKRDELFNKN